LIDGLTTNHHRGGGGCWKVLELPFCTDLSGISASDAELVGISRERGIVEHRLLIMIMRVWDSVWM
jgi:hypothetical protein